MKRSVGISALLLLSAAPAPAQSLFDLPTGVETRWYSFENPSGRRGEGGQSQEGRKGAASKTVQPGERPSSSRTWPVPASSAASG